MSLTAHSTLRLGCRSLSSRYATAPAPVSARAYSSLPFRHSCGRSPLTRSIGPSSASKTVQLSFSTGTTPIQQQQEISEEAEPPREMTSGEKDIHDILTKQFEPAHLQVQDVSGGCGSFYAIVIASSQFNGKPTVKAHRMVNEALKDIISGIHGLQLRTMPVKSD